MPDSTLATLGNIRTLVRRLTRSVSANQLADSDIDNAVNNFVLYDMPNHLRVFDMRSTFTFYCQPNIDTYSTNTTVATDPLFNFNNLYVTVHDPIYIAGYKAFFTLSREQMFGIYPLVRSIASVSSGNGVATVFTGTTPNNPMLQNQVLFSSVDINGNGLQLIDLPFNSQQGYLVAPSNNPQPPAGNPVPSTTNNFINYITGQFSVSFATAPAAGQAINIQNVPYVASLPQALCYYQDQFILRPVPDQPYAINMEVYVRPTELLAGNVIPSVLQTPTTTLQIAQWWQYIAYGAARKILQYRMEMETLALLEPEYKKQETLVLRKTIVQQAVERTATIYTEQVSYGPGSSYWGPYGGPF